MSTIDESSIFDDRTFLTLSSKCAEPFCWAYGMLRYRLFSPLDPSKFDNATSKIQEVATRIFIVSSALACLFFAGFVTTLAATVLTVGCITFRSIGVQLQKNGFTHVRGKAPETSLEKEQASVLLWDMSGEKLHYKKGVTHWRSRIDETLEKIKKEDPDVIILLGNHDTALSEALISRLEHTYAHFFTHLGANYLGNTSGCMVITKCAIHDFSHAKFENNGWGEAKGFETLEIKAHPEDTSPCLRIIGADLVSGKQNKERRSEQLAQIVNDLSQKKLSMHTLFAGNVNADPQSPDEGVSLSKYLYQCYRGDEPTHTDALSIQWDEKFTKLGEMIAFISLFKRKMPDGRLLPVLEKGIRLIDCHLVEAFDKSYNTKTALSPNHGLFAKFDLSQKPL